MKKILFAAAFFIFSINIFAQSEEVKSLHENAKAFMRQGDYANASLILVRALEQAPNNIEIAKDLAFDYYLQKENEKGINVIKPFLEKDIADDQGFQIAGMIYKAMGQPKEAEKLYKNALKNFPKSGPIYNDYGELLWRSQDYSAIKLWEKGIEVDPSYANNYYNASKYYFLTKDKIWSLIYGEIFINIESNSSRTAEIKNVLLDGYKKLFAESNLLQGFNSKNKFELAFLTTMNKQNSVVLKGINAETLTMIRTRFILDWNKDYEDKIPFKLFELHEQLLELGLFPAYNQWIFGAAQNLAAYQNWIGAHAEDYAAFNKFQQARLFKVPSGEYYH
ncbi:MAG TPA: tetratricopeptide repeat protein [Chitinophagaceae bacterium]|jgi:tetratricopeptide (TPR) repeat protein